LIPIAWYYLFEYLHRVMEKEEDWSFDPGLRNSLCSAIPVLACIWTNQGERSALAEDPIANRMELMRLDLDKDCSHCQTQNSPTGDRNGAASFPHIPADRVALMSRLILPFLRSRFILVS
jgi:hypothetical protein